MTERVIVIGAGGLAREVEWLIADLARAGEDVACRGFVVSDTTALGAYDSHGRVLGNLAWLVDEPREYDSVVIGIGTPSIRAKIAQLVTALLPEVRWRALVHPSVQFDRASAQIGPGAVLAAGTIGTVGIRVASHAFVNLACTLGHEAAVGAFAVINPTVNVSGGVVIEEEALVGTGAQILQYLRVGRGASIGAGAVVTRDVPAGSVVIGVPARERLR